MTSPGPRFAEVAVNAGQPTRTPFTYEVPASMALAAGQAVFVPFGPRILQGVVLEIASATEVEEVRPVSAVADPVQVLDSLHIALARWLSARYLAPLWDCVAVSLPPGYGQKSVTMVSPVDVPPLLPIDPRDRRILQYIASHGRTALDTLQEAVGSVTAARLHRLQQAGHLSVAQGLARPAGRARFERRVRLLRSGADAMARAAELEARRPASVDARLLRLLAAESEVLLAGAREAGASHAHLERLAAGGWLEEFEHQLERGDPFGAGLPATPGPLVLTSEQEGTFTRAASATGTYLLHGVTGAGKTEVYIALALRTLAAGRGVIILVPEIALTPQAARRYGERFGATLAVLHSGMGIGELYDQWHRVERGDARVVLGARSAIFAPVRDPGLVVIDEEHEWTYKQADRSPRYDARDAAAELCRLAGATLVLGSATPSVTSYHASERGQSTRLELATRVAPGEGGAAAGQLPNVIVADMREELKAGNRSVFSFALTRAVESALGAGEQSILFVNRRGSARFLLCRDCGYVPLCSSCDLSYSLDLADPANPRLRCHHCGRTKKQEDRCPRCASARYRPFGVGTQRIEEFARREFPRARVARWDSDVARRKGSHERMVAALEARAIDIVVGTQMLAKGLDLPAMMVVGVVDADVGLSLPDYTAHERAFQLLSQVAGRAGRRGRPGTVVFQTYDPSAPPIACAATNSYRAFYEYEVAHRRRAGYPPFARLVKLLHRDTNEERGLQEAGRVAADLRLRRDSAGRAEPDILGPAPAFIARLRGEYRWQILLRGRDPAALVAPIRLGDRWTVDVDPAQLL